jgi:hypothetical protein
VRETTVTAAIAAEEEVRVRERAGKALGGREGKLIMEED